MDDELRFDLSGSIIPPEQQLSLPTYLGLHHHAGNTDAAGYTLSDLLLIARSSVPAQRSSMLGVLGRIVRRLSRREPRFQSATLQKLGDVRQKAIAAALAAFTEKGSILVQAIDLLWLCIVLWEHDVVEVLQGIELWVSMPQTEEEKGSADEAAQAPAGGKDDLTALPFAAMLPQLTRNLKLPSLPAESRFQLFAITHRLARHSIEIATKIVETPQLVAETVQKFLLTPVAPIEGNLLPEPLALDLLCILAASSRANAKTLVGPADALLRFVTSFSGSLPSDTMWPRSLEMALLGGTLRLYTILARYGLYAGVAATAAEHFCRLSKYLSEHSEDEGEDKVADSAKDGLRETWFQLLSTWMVCALDPHRTVPAHDLLWSQVKGWSWIEDVLSCRDVLLRRSVASEEGVALWGSLWSALASWLEGCRVNSERAGQEERNTINAAIVESWIGQGERSVLVDLITFVEDVLSTPLDNSSSLREAAAYLARLDALGRSLNDFMSLCLACLGNVDGGEEMQKYSSWIIEATKLLLPLVKKITVHPVWTQHEPDSADVNGILLSRLRNRHLRYMSSFLASYVKVIHKLSPIENDWFALGFAVLEILQPGEESYALWLIEAIVKAEGELRGNFKKLELLMPFYKYAIRPDESVQLSPSIATPDSIQLCTSQWLLARRPATRTNLYGLPLRRDWPSVPIDHLLRSGTSPIFANPNAVPETWDASEVDLVQASLSLTKGIQERLLKAGGSYGAFVFGMEHAAFLCMKVFMLEHMQQEQSDFVEEVFRDPLVEHLMEDILRPHQYSVGRRETGTSRLRKSQLQPPRTSLEDVSRAFLSQGQTPFYQFYTDFVALYDAISYSHAIFARLLLPPTSNAYALDYRKLLWGDYGHLLRTVRTSVDDLLVNEGGLDGYLWPVENEPEMLGWYVRALVKWPLDGFLRFIAVHHVACNIWNDLLVTEKESVQGIKGGEEASSPAVSPASEPAPVDPTSASGASPSRPTPGAREKRARSLFQTLVAQAKPDIVRDVVRYTQRQPPSASLSLPHDSHSSSLFSPESTATDTDIKSDNTAATSYLLPPHCVSSHFLPESQRLSRLRAIREWDGAQMAEAMAREIFQIEPLKIQ